MLNKAVPLLLTAIASCIATEHLLQESGHLQDPQGFAVQTGYEGFLIPSEQASLLHSIPIGPILGVKAAVKAGLWFFGLLVVVLTGAGLATAVCAFTPLCTLGLAFGRRSDKISILTSFVHDALDKYSRLQTRKT